MSAEPELKNKPEDSDFKQQRLKAWQPILTPEYVILTFASVGVIFLAVGIAVLMASNAVVEIESAEYQATDPASGTCTRGDGSTSTSCLIDVSMEVTEDMDAPIYMYYHLSNFYQNHRRYVKSRSDIQLRDGGNYDTDGCEPLATRGCGAAVTIDGTSVAAASGAGQCSVYPCGLIAWSVFNDTFYQKDWATTGATSGCTTDTSCVSVRRTGASSDEQVPWTSDGIAWSSDKDKKFITTTTAVTPGDSSSACTTGSCITMPYDNFKYFKCTGGLTDAQCAQATNVHKRYADVANEEFIVWMRTSGLPTFRKLHRIINTDLKKGDVVHFNINNVFPVAAFSGTKKIVLSTTTWIGGKNQFLGWTYIVVAIICLLLAIAFFLKQSLNPREPATELETSLREADN
jgi:hypothetical protein